MPANLLLDAVVRSLKSNHSDYKISDGEGLNLLVKANGSRLWRLSYRFNGKQKTLALGIYPHVKLADARQMKNSARLLLRAGDDPGAQRRALKSAAIEDDRTFKTVAEAWFKSRTAQWTAGHSVRVWGRIEADLIPALASEDVAAITPVALLKALRVIETRGAIETAHRVRKYAEDIFDFAKACQLVSINPASDLGPALSRPTPVVHHPSLKAAQLPTFLNLLNGYDGDFVTKAAIQLALLTFVRTKELRFAQWDEFDGFGSKEPIWRVPAERMKMRSPHIVPLSTQAVTVLKSLKPPEARAGFVFPAATKSGVISENTMIYGLYRLGYHSRATVHGFRSTASTILNEQGYNRDWIERQLAHSERDDVRAAYNTAEWLPQRRRMMQSWGKYLAKLPSAQAPNDWRRRLFRIQRKR